MGYETRIYSNRTTAVPLELLKEMKLSPGDMVRWKKEDGRLIVQKVRTTLVGGKRT